jgi:hypothetical protein
MGRDLGDLRHDLHWSPGVFFKLRDQPNEAQLGAVLDVFEKDVGPNIGASPREHWQALQRRIRGETPWHAVVPAYTGELETIEGRKAWGSTVQTGVRIAEKRPYAAYVRDGIHYVVDVFNPTDELGLAYATAGEPVLTVQMSDITADPTLVFQRLPIRDRLGEIESFYRLLMDLIVLLKPERVVGGTYLGRLMLAYAQNRPHPSKASSPWDLLWTLTGVDRERLAGTTMDQIASHFWRAIQVESYHPILLQVVPRFDSVMGTEYVRAARLLGMTSVTELGGQ